MATPNAKLKVQDLSLSFGGVEALANVNLEVGERELMAIIGPNGAGKTVLLNCYAATWDQGKCDMECTG